MGWWVVMDIGGGGSGGWRRGGTRDKWLMGLQQ